MLFSNIFHFNLSFEDSSMKIETLRMFEKKSRDVKVLEKEGNRGVINSTRKREREEVQREKCKEGGEGKSIADALEKSLPFLGE